MRKAEIIKILVEVYRDDKKELAKMETTELETRLEGFDDFSFMLSEEWYQ